MIDFQEKMWRFAVGMFSNFTYIQIIYSVNVSILFQFFLVAQPQFRRCPTSCYIMHAPDFEQDKCVGHPLPFVDSADMCK